MSRTRETIRVMIVEDDPYFNKVLTKYIQAICNPAQYPEFRFEVESFTDAHECIRHMNYKTDIAILDYVLINDEEEEVLSGMDVMNELKEHNPDCKVIVFSSQQSAYVAAAFMKAGVHEYIDKTMNTRDRLGSVVHSILRNYEGAYS